VTHWDTFEEPGEDTFTLGHFTTFEDARSFIETEYGDGGGSGQRLRADGADRVEIRFNGSLVWSSPCG